MKQVYFLLSLFLLIGWTAQAQEADTIRERVYFDFDKHELTPEATALLENLIVEGQFLKIFIEGHTDSKGSNEYNARLSKNRVQAVYDYFISKNIHTSLIRTFAHGEGLPLFKNDTETSMAKNRRVDIMVLIEKGGLEKTLITTKEPLNEVKEAPNYDWLNDNFKSIEAYLERFQTDIDTFTITSSDTLLVTPDGLIINIPADAFTFNGDKNTQINLMVHESLSLSDMLKNGMVSMDNSGNVLESGGMLNINAKTESGEAVTLNKEIKLYFPNLKKKYNMEYFIGKEIKSEFVDSFNQSTTRNQVLWERAFETAQFFSVPFNTSYEIIPPCCDPNDCIFKEGKLQVALWKMFKNNTYQSYQTGQRKAKEELYQKCIKWSATQNALNQSIANWMASNQNFQNISELTYYSFSIRSLGNVNCDQYIRQPRQPMVTLKVDLPTHSAIDVFFVGRSSNIVTRGNYAGRSVTVPQHTPMTVFGIGVDENDQPYLGIKYVRASNKTVQLNFKKITEKELEKQMIALDLK